MTKIIKITKCFEECPHCIGPNYNKKRKTMQFSCDETGDWLDNVDIIPDSCELVEWHEFYTKQKLSEKEKGK
ncbi:MAG: hypothetical protein GY834_10700 [Bacteroidetes bacterium]|nr:hypothetical protein [Bacteroidota bacterium]